MLLDLAVRDATSNKKSLRDIFHWLNDYYAKKGRFFPESAGIQQAAEAVCSCALKQFFADYVAGVVPLDYDKYFRSVGLKLNKTTATVPDPGFRLGRGQAAVSQVDSGSPAAQAGLKVGDTIQQVNGKPVAEVQISSLKVGDEVKLTLVGDREIVFRLAGRNEDRFALIDLDNVTVDQRERRAAWIRGD